MKTLTFRTKNETLEFLRNQEYLIEVGNVFFPADKYYLKHGEYSLPNFKPVHYRDGWGVKKIHYYHANTINAPTDGRCIIVDGVLTR